MGTFAYIAYLIPIVTVEYVLIILLFRYYSQKLKTEKESLEGEHEMLLSDSETSNYVSFGEKSWFCSYSFMDTYNSIFGENSKYLLLTSRLLTFSYFASVSIGFNFYLRPHGWNYFTVWNLILITFYFLLSSMCSIIGIFWNGWVTSIIEASIRKPKAAELFAETTHRNIKIIQALSILTHVIFEVAGSTALMVTFVNFTLLNPKFEFWNVNAHFINSCVFLLEMLQTKLPVYILHYPYALTWMGIFCVFTWIIVAYNVRYWPYDFMVAGTPLCIVWYSGLFILNFGFYCLWNGLSRLKQYYYPDTSVTNDGQRKRTVSDDTNYSNRSTLVTVSLNQSYSRPLIDSNFHYEVVNDNVQHV